MTIPNWIIGLMFVVLVVIQLLWAADLIVSTLATAIHRRRWRVPLRSGAFWLGVYNLTTSVLHGWFVLIVFREPWKQQSVAIAALIASMVLPAILAWFWLPRTRIEEKESP